MTFRNQDGTDDIKNIKFTPEMIKNGKKTILCRSIEQDGTFRYARYENANRYANEKFNKNNKLHKHNHKRNHKRKESNNLKKGKDRGRGKEMQMRKLLTTFRNLFPKLYLPECRKKM